VTSAFNIGNIIRDNRESFYGILIFVNIRNRWACFESEKE